MPDAGDQPVAPKPARSLTGFYVAICVLVSGLIAYYFACQPAMFQRGYPQIEPWLIGLTWTWFVPVALATVFEDQLKRCWVPLLIYAVLTGYVDAGTFVDRVPYHPNPVKMIGVTLLVTGPLHMLGTALTFGVSSAVLRRSKELRSRAATRMRIPLAKMLVFITVVLTAGVLVPVGYNRISYWPVPTRQLVMELNMACGNLLVETGQYPWPKPDSVTATTEIRGKDVYVELRGLPGATINTNQDYLAEVKKRLLKNGTLVDQWGHEIMFRVDPKSGVPVVWSCGKNGKDDTNTGISPDPVKFPKTYYWFGSGSTGDDLTNLPVSEWAPWAPPPLPPPLPLRGNPGAGNPGAGNPRAVTGNPGAVTDSFPRGIRLTVEGIGIVPAAVGY